MSHGQDIDTCGRDFIDNAVVTQEDFPNRFFFIFRHRASGPGLLTDSIAPFDQAVYPLFGIPRLIPGDVSIDLF